MAAKERLFGPEAFSAGRASGQRHHASVFQRDTTIHPARQIEVMGGHQGREPRLLHKRRSVANTWSPVAGSRLPVGSSASSRRGALATARAIATRCCSPPDNSPGRCSSAMPSPRKPKTSRARPCRFRNGKPGNALRQHDILHGREFAATGDGTDRQSRSQCGGGACAPHHRARRLRVSPMKTSPSSAVRADRRYAEALIFRRRRAQPVPPFRPDWMTKIGTSEHA